MSDDAVLIDYELDDAVTADTPARLRAVADPVRTLILDLVLERAMTVTELAAEVGRSKGTVAHHVAVLVDTGLLKVVRTRKVRAIEERFYGRVARTIMFPKTDRVMPFVEDALAEYDATAHAAGRAADSQTLRHARIPQERAEEFAARLQELAVEFTREPRAGDVEYGLLIALYPTTRRSRSRR